MQGRGADPFSPEVTVEGVTEAGGISSSLRGGSQVGGYRAGWGVSCGGGIMQGGGCHARGVSCGGGYHPGQGVAMPALPFPGRAPETRGVVKEDGWGGTKEPGQCKVGGGDTQKPSGGLRGESGGVPLRTRLPCSTSPRGAPAAAADMLGGAVVCLPTAGGVRETALAAGGATGGGEQPGPPPTTPPSPSQTALGVPITLVSGDALSCVPPMSPTCPPTLEGLSGWGGDTGGWGATCCWVGGAGGAAPAPPQGERRPRPR